MSAVARAVFTRRLHVSARRNALSKFSMPAMSPTMTEGGIASWKVKEGQAFTAGDILLEIETDKATMDVEAQDDGVMAKIIVGDGSKGVPVGTPIAVLGEEGDDLASAAKFAEDAASSTPAAEAPKEESQSAPPPPSEAPKSSEKPSSAPAKEELAKGERIFASPIAKKIALERGIPLAKVKGTGPEGRIVREDVEKFKPEAAAPAASTSAAKGAPAPAAAQASADYVDTPVSNMRKTIGARLTQSKQELPHYYLTVDIDMGRVNKLREVFNKSLTEKDPSSKLSVNDFIVKAASLALKDVPEVNSAWLGDVIRQYTKADISVAVATPTGLITPIVKDAGGKGLASISSETKALAKKARDGKLAPHEYQGGSFTISNLGMFGVSHFTAIINPPQSAILAVGSTNATMVPNPASEKGWDVKQVMKATLSADHRVVDGAVGARWMAAFKSYLENPLTFML